MTHDDLIELLQKIERPCVYLLLGTTICVCVLIETLGYGKTPLWFTGGIAVSFASWYFTRGKRKKAKPPTNDPNE
jgi:hypothetical protein